LNYLNPVELLPISVRSTWKQLIKFVKLPSTRLIQKTKLSHIQTIYVIQ